MLWGTLAVVHVTQALWLSGFKAYPGDLGDGRFNQLVLEHGYKSWKGVYEWKSPGQFYPQPGTLSFSDTHAGTLPIYITLRWLSISREEAWQLWFVIVAALNVYAAFRFFRALNLAAPLRGPLVFASAGSVTMAWLTGTHMQMLPIFPALLAWEQLLRWRDDRTWWRMAAALGWLAWQFAAGPYSAFFAVVIAAAVSLAFAMVRPPPNATAHLPPQRVDRIFAGGVLLAGALLALAAARIHLDGLHAGHSRPMNELIELAPTWASWFTASPMHLFYPAGWPGNAANLVENAWLAGFLPWLLLMVVALEAYRLRKTARVRWALTLALGVFITLVFFTKWPGTDFSPWLWLAEHVEPLRAFRSSGRAAGLLQFVLIGGAGALLTQWWSVARKPAASVACVALACLIAVETLGHHQPFTRVAVARARTAAMVEAWERNGDRPVLAFAPGFSNQQEAWMQLDAWSAALAKHRVTINGYSGGIAGSHVQFIWKPTARNARSFIGTAGIPEENVSIVEEWSEEAEARLGFVRFPERPLSRLEGFELQPTGWDLFAPLATFQIEGRTMHQFTPPGEVRFALPAGVSRLSVDLAMREGSYDRGGGSDGVGLSWIMRSGNSETIVATEYIDPAAQPEHRGILRREFPLPAGDSRLLILRIDAGPAASNAWDWPVFGNLRVE